MQDDNQQPQVNSDKNRLSNLEQDLANIQNKVETNHEVQESSTVEQSVKKTNSTAVILALLGLLAFGVSGWGLYLSKPSQNLSNSIVETSPTPESTANWKSYSNSSYGISFKYPEELIINENKLSSEIQVTLKRGSINLFTISADNEYPSNQPKYFLGSESSGNRKIGDIVWQEFYLSEGYQDAGNQNSNPIYALQIEKNKTLYSVSGFTSKELNSESLQILSTIEFANNDIEMKVYNDSNNRFSFSYPSNWKIVSSVPEKYLDHDISSKPNWKEYYNSTEGQNYWLSGKMFVGNCRGPILQNINDGNQLIAFEVVEANSDGGWCWSVGHFFEGDKWKVAENYMYPITQDNSGKLITPEWKGDFFKYQNVDKNSSWLVSAGLANIGTYSLKGLEDFQKIISSFKFAN